MSGVSWVVHPDEFIDAGIIFYIDFRKLGRHLTITLKCRRKHETVLIWYIDEQYPHLPTMEFCKCGRRMDIVDVVASKEKP